MDGKARMLIPSRFLHLLKLAMGYLIPTLAFIYFIWVLLLLPVICGPKVHSPYNEFDIELNNNVEKDKNLMRKIGATMYLDAIDGETSRNYYASLFTGEIEHLILVIAEGPTSKSYLLTQLLTQLDREFHRSNTAKHAMLICDRRINAKDPELENLVHYFPILRPNATQAKYAWKNQQENKRSNFVHCVELGLAKTKPHHVSVLWDFIIPHTKFIPYLDHILATKIEAHFVRGELQKRLDPWLFLHLHEPLNMRSYDSSFSSFRELITIATIGGCLFFFIAGFLNPGVSSNSSKVILTLYGSIVFVTLAVSFGRPYLTELRWLLPDFLKVREFFGAIPLTSVTLPYESALKMLDYLKGLSCSPYVTFDDVWDHAIGTLEIPAYVVSPSLVRRVNS